MQQVISAIDGITGSTDWRDQSVVELGAGGKGAGLSLFGQFKKREWLVAQECLGCIVSRKYADIVLDAILAGGASGANVSYAKFIEAESRTTASGTRFNREAGFVRCILNKSMVEQVRNSVKSACNEHDIKDVCIFTLPITRAITYVAPNQSENTPIERTYRGARV